MIRVISFSLFLIDNEKIDFYALGLLENIEIIHRLLPDWGIYIYHDHTISPTFIKYIEQLKCICIKCNKTHNWMGMFWRFYPLENKHVDVFISRDADSRITEKEVYTINEWLKSDKILYLLRGHISHIQMCGGLWGIKPKEFNKKNLNNTIKHALAKYIKKYPNKIKPKRLGNFNGPDQEYLNEIILPLCKNNIFGYCEKGIKKYNYEIEICSKNGNFFGSRQSVCLLTKEKYKDLSNDLHNYYDSLI